jgi:hypothetical protein
MTTAMTRPSDAGDAPLPRRSLRGLLPSTWTGRAVNVAYVGANGKAVSASGSLLELYPFGPVLNVEGIRTAISWDALRVIELELD